MTKRSTTALALIATLCGCVTLPDWLAVERAPAFVAANRFVLTQPGQEVIGHLYAVEARHEDTLPALARRYDLGYDEIVGANPGVDVWLPGAGTRILLPTRYVLPDSPREGIVINVAARRLFYYPADEPGVVITYPVGIGRDDWATPLGTASVTQKVTDPSWYPPVSIRRERARKGDPLPAVVPPGPDNPLGRYALLLSMDGYLIHGTNKPAGVGMQVSHGCIRLYPEDVAAMFPDLPLGTPVRIVDQPLLLGWDGDALYLQSYLTSTAGTDSAAADATGTDEAGEIDRLIREAMQRRGVEALEVRLDQEQLSANLALRGVAVAITRNGPDIERVLRTAALVERPSAED